MDFVVTFKNRDDFRQHWSEAFAADTIEDEPDFLESIEDLEVVGFHIGARRGFGCISNNGEIWRNGRFPAVMGEEKRSIGTVVAGEKDELIKDEMLFFPGSFLVLRSENIDHRFSFIHGKPHNMPPEKVGYSEAIFGLDFKMMQR